MRNATLPTSSFVVLGLLAARGPMTPYELKKAIDGSIGYFWSFPRAQLYVEPERLTALGLLTEEREREGRQRRIYSITDAGKAALGDWLTSDVGAPVELRDPGLLKLYFSCHLPREDVIALARAQQATHRARLAEYERIEAVLADDPTADFARATLRMGLRYEQESVAFWAAVAEHPPENQSVTTEITEITETTDNRSTGHGQR